MVSVFEQCCISKTGDNRFNEDGLFVSDKFIVVIDGTTSKNDYLYNNKTGGQNIRDIIIQSISSLKGKESCVEAISYIQNRIIEVFSEDNNFHASATAIIYSINLRQIWFIGDCQAMVNGIGYSNKKEVDCVFSKARSIAISAILETGKSIDDLRKNDLARELILPLLKYQSNLENTQGRYGYLVFNNRHMSQEYIKEKCVVIDVPNNSEVVLASDGYPQLCGSLSETEELLKELLKKDPLCYKELIGTKGVIDGNISFDDRTYIRFST